MEIVVVASSALIPTEKILENKSQRTKMETRNDRPDNWNEVRSREEMGAGWSLSKGPHNVERPRTKDIQYNPK